MKIEGGPGEIEQVELHREAVAGGGGGLGHGRGGGGACRVRKMILRRERCKVARAHTCRAARLYMHVR